jgi:hypothetical protein
MWLVQYRLTEIFLHTSVDDISQIKIFFLDMLSFLCTPFKCTMDDKKYK